MTTGCIASDDRTTDTRGALLFACSLPECASQFQRREVDLFQLLQCHSQLHLCRLLLHLFSRILQCLCPMFRRMFRRVGTVRWFAKCSKRHTNGPARTRKSEPISILQIFANNFVYISLGAQENSEERPMSSVTSSGSTFSRSLFMPPPLVVLLVVLQCWLLLQLDRQQPAFSPLTTKNYFSVVVVVVVSNNLVLRCVATQRCFCGDAFLLEDHHTNTTTRRHHEQR